MQLKPDLSNTKIQTKRLFLRPFTLNDIDDFYEYSKVEGVGELAGWKHHKDKEESEKIIKMFLENKDSLAIEYNGKVIGSVGVHNFDEKNFKDIENKKGIEIGYALSKDYWGKGIMTEAVKGFIEYLFNRCRLDFLVCSYYENNIRSKRVQEKCSFNFVCYGTLKDVYNNDIKTVYNILEK